MIDLGYNMQKALSLAGSGFPQSLGALFSMMTVLGFSDESTITSTSLVHDTIRQSCQQLNLLQTHLGNLSWLMSQCCECMAGIEGGGGDDNTTGCYLGSLNALGVSAAAVAKVLKGQVLPQLAVVLARLAKSAPAEVEGACSSGNNSKRTAKHKQQPLPERLDASEPQLGRPLYALCLALVQTGSQLQPRLSSRYICNNLACANMATVSAAFQLVRGRACVCGGCVSVLQHCTSEPPAAASGVARAEWEDATTFSAR